MKELLTEDAYSIENIRNIFSKEYPHLNPNLIISYNIKNLGFRIYSGYVIRDTYPNAFEYFNSIILKNDIVDLTNINKNIFGNTIYNYLRNLRTNRDIIEFSPNKYISIRKLNENNIYIKDLNDYCDEVYRYLDKGTFFTVHSLRNDKFKHYSDDLGFDEYFYSSIIVADNRFSYRRLGDTNLIFIGQRKIALSDLIIYIVKSEKKIDLYDLEDLLMNRYGIKFNKDKIVEIIKDTDLYYSKIMKVVYANYDTYFEEV